MRRVIAAVLLLAAARAGAVEYELPIDVETEEDLQELLFKEEISEETYAALLDLLRRGVDLSRADAEEIYALPDLTQADVDAILAYRAAAGGIPDPGALLAAGVLSDEKLRAIAPFLVVSRTDEPGAPAVSGRVRYRSLYTPSDSRLPPMALESKVTTLRRLSVAAAVVITRNYIGGIRYDGTRDALSAEGRATRVHVPKAYAYWKAPAFEAIAGSYMIGFGQRLTFDESTVYTPNGIYPEATIRREGELVRECIESQGELDATPCSSAFRTYVTPDFDWSEKLFGAAVSARKIPAGPGWLQLSGWGSAQLRDIYQYELYDKNRCPDPTDDDDDDCRAPFVFKRGADPSEPSSRFSFQTLPGMWWELLGGANASWFASRRTHLGVTGWGARPSWLVGGIALDFQEYSRFPRGGPYGAAGVDFAWGRSWFDLGVEITRSFDSMPGGGGGLGALARGTVTWSKNELELSLRYYDDDFVNPHTGAIAEPDEVDGQRARDEAGFRVRYAGRPSRRLSTRLMADFWMAPSSETPKARVEGRADYLVNRKVRAGVYGRWGDKDLREGGHALPEDPDRGQCYESPIEIEGELIPCKGQRLDLGTIVRLDPTREMSFVLQAQLRVTDDIEYNDTFRYGGYGWLTMNWWLSNNARLRARVHYEKPDLNNEASQMRFYGYEEILDGFVQLTYRLPRSFLVSARYEVRAYLNEDVRTYARDPSPEHWLALEVEARF